MVGYAMAPPAILNRSASGTPEKLLSLNVIPHEKSLLYAIIKRLIVAWKFYV